MSDSHHQPVTVLYVGGTGRSGTTLLERILGQAAGCCAVGELVFLWERGLRGNERCGCGEPFGACPFWTQVGKEAFGGWDSVDLDEVQALQQQVDRHRYLPNMLAPRLSTAYDRRLDRYGEILERVYRAIRTASGQPVVIDSSKDASHAFLLRRLPGVDLRLAHLVRRSHGVAYSWTKKVRKPEVSNAEAYMHKQAPGVTAMYWMNDNLLLDSLRLLRVPSYRLRYESLVARPREHAGALLRLAGAGAAAGAPGAAGPDLDFIGDGQVDLGVNHTVAGNPMRFHQGRLALRADDEWSDAMPSGQRRTVTAITWPLLLRYGYRLGGANHEGGRRPDRDRGRSG
jgi:Sulfotransferase family